MKSSGEGLEISGKDCTESMSHARQGIFKKPKDSRPSCAGRNPASSV